jgi:ferredoxin
MIFYFSGTGNTRWAAEQLAQATGERLLSMAEELRSGNGCYELSEGERIGFCFAVHGWQPPHIVRQFIRQLRISGAEGHFCYALVTCGDSIGCTTEMLGSELAAVGLRVESAFSLVMPESYVCLPFMYTDTPERERQKLEQARRQLDDYCRLIIDCKKVTSLVKGFAPWLMSHVIGAYFNSRMVTDKKFAVDADACIHCGKCQTVCKTHNLTIAADGLPHWQHAGACTCCLACYHHCPRHAINYGNITRRRGQYYYGHTRQNLKP